MKELRFVGEPGDAILQVFDVEVDEQSNAFVTELQVRKKLSVVDG